MTIPTDIPTTDFHDKRIALCNWLPRVEDLGVPVPETHGLTLDHETDGLPGWDTEEAVAIVNDLNGEAFARTDFKSAYDLHEGSYINAADPEAIDFTLSILISDQAMMQMPLGSQVYLREFLDLDWNHYARNTLHPEVRVFVRDGDVVCYHPRLEWEQDEAAGVVYSDQAENIIDDLWDDDIRPHAEAVAAEFEEDGIGYSVDFVITTDYDCYLTDMAVDALYERDGQYQNISAHPGDCAHDYENQI